MGKLGNALKKVGSIIGDVAKTAFNAIPLIPNIPADKFSNKGIAAASNIVSGVTDLVGKTVTNIIPGGKVIQSAANIIGSLIPSTKSGSKAATALPTSIPTNGATTMTLQATVKPFKIDTPISKLVPNTIGLFQQTAAAPTSVGKSVQVPVNGSGVGLFTQDVPPVAFSNAGVVMGSTGILAQTPAGVGNPSDLLPTSDPMQKISDLFGGKSDTANKPTNAGTPQQTQTPFSMGTIVMIVIAVVGLIVGLLFGRRK